MQRDVAITFLLGIEQVQPPSIEITSNIYLRSIIKNIDSLYTLHQICHADKLFNRRRQYIKSEVLIEMATENQIGTLGRLFVRALPYLNEDILTFYIMKIEMKRSMIYAVSKHLNVPPTNKYEFDQVANKIYG